MRYTKPEVQSDIQCSHCKGNSGYKNSDISQVRHLKEDIKLKCKNCNNTAVIIKGKNVTEDLENLKHII